jgi:hypothetical protein
MLGSISLAAAISVFGRTHGLAAPLPAAKGGPRYRVEHETLGTAELQVHGGDGLIQVKAFGFGGAARPSLMLTYLIPPGGSEGVHRHELGSPSLGSYDEFYYVLAGAGVMDIDGEPVGVAAGDHVFTPLGVPHGIRNTSPGAALKVLLTAVERF